MRLHPGSTSDIASLSRRCVLIIYENELHFDRFSSANRSITWSRLEQILAYDLCMCFISVGCTVVVYWIVGEC